MIVRGISPTIVTYNSLFNGFCLVGQLKEACPLLKEMIAKNINLNVYTFGIIVDVLCKEGNVVEVQHVFNMMTERGLDPDIVIYNPLIC